MIDAGVDNKTMIVDRVTGSCDLGRDVINPALNVGNRPASKVNARALRSCVPSRQEI